MTTPELDERRIDAMRSSIMSAVDADVARRGRRTRRAVGTLAAACLVVVVGGVGFSSITRTTGTSDSVGSTQAASVPEVADDAAADSRVAQREEREVITTGNVEVTVESPRAVAERFAAWVEARSGRVDGRSESRDDEGRTSASLTVRIPSTQVSKALAQLATYGDVGSVDIQNEDVTTQGRDLDARIRALELSINRLEKILAEADTSAEVVRAEGALTRRQEQLESLQAQREALKEQVALSTLYVHLTEKGSASSVSPGGFQGGLTKGWDALVDTVNGIVALAGVLVPWLAIAVVVWVLWRLGRRLTRRGGAA
jgi:hypothetical protein